jgi:acetyl-CoA acetyltransferase family protein
MKNAFLIDIVRTPRGRLSRPKKNFVGELANVHPATLGALLVDALLDRNPSIPPEKVEDLFYSVVNANLEQAANMGRTVVLSSRLPETTSGITMNRACSGALQAVAFANASISVGDYDLLMAGGGEHMNMVRIDKAMDPKHLPFPMDLFGKYRIGTQGDAAEMMCEKYNLNQQEIDAFSVRSHKLADEATRAGRFKNEIVPVPYTDQEGNNQILDWDSNIMADTTVEKITALPRPFKENGLIHAASSSAIVDGCSLSLWASETACEQYGLKPRARILASTNAGVKPDIMLDGVIPGTELALQRSGLTVDDIDLFEINEAFACVPVAWMKELGIPEKKVNVNGGAIAMGHPLGGTGGILLATLLNEMERRDLRLGMITMCAAYGQSGTMIIERVQ